MLSSRIKSVLDANDLQKVAIKSGVKSRSLYNYTNGALPDLASLIAIAGACGISMDWLVSGTGPRDLEPTIIAASNIDGSSDEAKSPSQSLSDTGKSRYVAIPRLNIAASAGYGALAEHAQVVEYLAFDVDFVRSRLRRDPKHLVLIEARGDSMEPTIRDGDILTVDLTPDQPLAHAHLYILRVDDDLMVKRLERRLDGALIVSSDNPRYRAETVERERLDSLKILGQVLLVSAPPR